MTRVSTAASERVAACSSEPAAAEPLPALAEIEAMRCLELAEHDAKRLEHDAMLHEATSEVQGAKCEEQGAQGASDWSVCGRGGAFHGAFAVVISRGGHGGSQAAS